MRDLVYIEESPGCLRMIDRALAPKGARILSRPSAATTRIVIRHGRAGERPNHGAVQPDVQYYRPYMGKRTPLTGTWEEREAKIRELDAADNGREEAEKREIVNLK